MAVLPDRDPAAAERRKARRGEGRMTKEEIKNLFMQGIDCSQVVTGQFAKQMQMNQDQARKVSACFGGGMMCGETCGAVTGALMVIGMVYGHSREGDQEQKNVMAEKTNQFRKMFLEKYPSSMCREILGHDISKPGEMEKVMEKGLLFDLCPEVVENTIEILEKIL